MESACPTGEQEPEFRTMSVNIVVSAPRIHPWILRLPGSQALSSINTTHWGLKVGSSYHDLKMVGLFQTKPDVAFSTTLATRDERESSKSIFIGTTHFTNEQIRDFARHRLKHAPWYQFWFDNCQGFIVNNLARHILCLRCSNDAPDFSRNAQLNAMLDIASLRPFEFLHLIGIVMASLIDYYFNLTMAEIGSPETYRYTILRLICVCWLFMMGLYRTDQMQTERKEDEILFQNGVQASRYHDLDSRTIRLENNTHKGIRIQLSTRTQENQSSNISKEVTKVDRPSTENLDEAKQRIGRVTFMESLQSSRILIPVAIVGWNYKYLQVQNSLSQAIILLVVVIVLLFLFSYGEGTRLWFPHVRPDRKGRSTVHGPCQACSLFSRRLFLDTRHCAQEMDGFLSSPPFRRSGMTWLPESPWLSEDSSFLWLRAMLYLAVHLLVYENKPFIKYFARQWLFQSLLNPLSPVTPWGNTLRESIYCTSLIWNNGVIDLFSTM